MGCIAWPLGNHLGSPAFPFPQSWLWPKPSTPPASLAWCLLLCWSLSVCCQSAPLSEKYNHWFVRRSDQRFPTSKCFGNAALADLTADRVGENQPQAIEARRTFCYRSPNVSFQLTGVAGVLFRAAAGATLNAVVRVLVLSHRPQSRTVALFFGILAACKMRTTLTHDELLFYHTGFWRQIIKKKIQSKNNSSSIHPSIFNSMFPHLGSHIPADCGLSGARPGLVTSQWKGTPVRHHQVCSKCSWF